MSSIAPSSSRIGCEKFARKSLRWLSGPNSNADANLGQNREKKGRKCESGALADSLAAPGEFRKLRKHR